MRGCLSVILLLTASSVLTGCLGSLGDGDASTAEVSAVPPPPWVDDWEIVALDFSYDIDPSVPNVDAEGKLVIENTLGEPRDHVFLWLPGFDVTSLKDEEGRDLDYTVNAGEPFLPLDDEIHAMRPSQELKVTLTGATGPGERRTLTMTYTGWASDALTSASGARENAAHLMLLSPVTTGAPNVADNRFTITSPVDWTVLGAGHLLEREVVGDREVASYYNPQPFVNAFASDGLQYLEDDVDGVEVRTYHHPEMAEQARAFHETSLRVLRTLPEWTGAYPYDHLWTVPHRNIGSSFNYPGTTFMGVPDYRAGQSAVPLQYGREGVPFLAGEHGYEGVLVHEHTHNWWAQMVRGGIGSPDRGPVDRWIDEGVTTYLAESVWWDRVYDEDTARESAEHMVRRLDARRVNWGGERAITEDGGDYYAKAALALRTLEAYAIATERPDAVLDALKLTMERFGRQHGGPGLVTTHDVLPVIEESFGESLEWWWEPLFFAQNLPDLAIEAYDEDGDAATVTVANLGQAAAPVLVQAETAAGSHVRAWGFVEPDADAEVQLNVTELDAPVVRVSVDPLQHVYEWDERNNARRVTPLGLT